MIDYHSSLLVGMSPTLIATLYRAYLNDHGAVTSSMQDYFKSLGADADLILKEAQGPSWSQTFSALGVCERAASMSVPITPNTPIPGHTAHAHRAHEHTDEQAQPPVQDYALQSYQLIEAFRTLGHTHAHLNPLHPKPEHPQMALTPAAYGFAEQDMAKTVAAHGFMGQREVRLSTLLTQLNRTYCGHLGIEYKHIPDSTAQSWLQTTIESRPIADMFNDTEKLKLFGYLHEAENFERFLHKKYPGAKRFGLEGAESTMILLHHITERAAIKFGATDTVLGMSHRGRLNVLCNFLQKKPRMLFKEFTGEPPFPENGHGSGDVKYHLGASADVRHGSHKMHLSLCPNPSHLEAVNPIVLGRVRAKQMLQKDTQRDHVFGIIMHGDAAFAGQGLVAETLLLSQLNGYKVGGTIHIIVNNHIGFTTDPIDSRSSLYSSDIAKMINAPILHVNGNDPEAVASAARLAIDYRYRFKRDIVIDLCCYRRHGHNEMDEPSFTQPKMYADIRDTPSVCESYKTQLEKEGVLTEAAHDALTADFNKRLDAEYVASRTYKPEKEEWLEGTWKGYDAILSDDQGKTAVLETVLATVGKTITTAPEGFALHPKIARLLNEKKKALEAGIGLDWATAEALAFGTLLLEGHPIRFSGQDVGRGTFSHRHAKWVDQNTGQPYYPLNHIADNQETMDIIESPLSEAGVLGFDYGYSMTAPETLTIWEAQFGDFANGAQVIMDQFISCAEAKWLRLSGLVMLLPHGYEGQGPEHSSARLERYLQLCADDNLIVANCSTPANYFHILRRQVRRTVRKPLVLMTPKSLLRHKQAVSSLEELGPGTTFRQIIAEENRNLVDNTKIRRVVLCSGKIFYELNTMRELLNIKDVALIRVEQLYPFPKEDLIRELSKYRKAQIVWCQEEPMNMGAWQYVEQPFENLLLEINHLYTRAAFVGRLAAASPATGFLAQHKIEQESLVEKALVIAGS